MRILKPLLFALLMLSLAACAGGDTTLTTLQEELEETATDVVATIAAAQGDIADIGQEIQESEASQELVDTWQDLQADLTVFFTSVQSEQTVDTTQVQTILDNFESELDEAGDQVTPELRETWESLRAQVERLLEQAG